MASADDFQIPKYDEILQRARDAVQSLVRNASLTPGADYDIITRVLSSLVFPMFGHIRYAIQQVFPDSAVENYLKRHGVMRDIKRKDPNTASGYALIRGLIGSTQPVSSTVKDDTGTEFTSSAPATIVQAVWTNKIVMFYDDRRPDTVVVSDTVGMAVGDAFGINGNFYVIKDLPGAGALRIYGRFKVNPSAGPIPDQLFPTPGVRLPLTSKLTGSVANLPYGTLAEISQPAVGVDAECEIIEMLGGADKEEPKDWARRMQEHDAEKPAANNRSQALQLCLDYPGVGEAYVYDVYRGLGTADLVPMGVKGARHLGTARIGEMQNDIAPRPPTDANPGYVAIGGHDWLFTDWIDRFVTLELVLQGGPGYGPAWIGTLITAGGCTTSRINTTVDPRTRVTLGSRVVIPVNPPLFIEERMIININAAGFDLDLPLLNAPAAGRTIRPGSDLIVPMRDAMIDMFDNLGPGDTNPPTRYPAPTTRGPAELTLNLIHAVARSVRGVKNAFIISPAFDVTPLPKERIVPLDLILRY